MTGQTSVRVAAVGDVMLVRPTMGQGGALVDETVRAHLMDADLSLANLEVPLTDRGHAADKAVVLRSPPELAAALPALGFDVVTVANNHALDFGIDGLRQTLGGVGPAGVAAIGGGENVDEALRPAVFSRHGMRVAFIGLACTLPPGFAATVHRPGIAPVRVMSEFVIDAVSIDEQPGMAPFVRTWASPADVERACETVADPRTDADTVVVAIHWGVPHGWVAAFQEEIAEYQQPLGHALTEAGADLIVGHHPHCLHAVETRSRSCIIYSCGNFLFHKVSDTSDLTLARDYPPYRLDSLLGRKTRESALFLADLSADGVERLEIVPILLDEVGEPTALRGEEALAVLERLAVASERFGTTLRIDANRARGALETG